MSYRAAFAGKAGRLESPGDESPDSIRGARVIMIAFHFFPSREVGAKRMSALARALAGRGHRVAVFSAFEGLDKLPPESVGASPLRDYELYRIADVPSSIIALMVRAKNSLLRLLRRGTRSASAHPAGSNVVAGREDARRSSLYRQLFNLLHIIDDKKRWAWHAARRVVTVAKRRRASVILVSGPPMSSMVGALLAGRRSRVPVIVDLRDPIWMNPSELNSLSTVSAQWGRRRLERYVVAHATRVVTTSPSLCRRLQALHPAGADRISCILNGFDGDPFPVAPSTGNRLVIVYAGTLYLNRNPFPFLEAVERLVAHPEVEASRVEVVLAGDCERYEGVSLRDWLATRNCGQLTTIHSWLDAAGLKRLYQRATLLLNLAEGQRMQVPAKTFELLALGREILTLCEPDSDTAAVSAGVPGVWCMRSSDAAGLEALLLDIYRRHAVQGVVRAPSAEEIARFSRAAQNERFIALLESVAAVPP